MAAARAGAPPPPLGDVVFLDPASFVPGSLRPRLPYWEEAVRGSPQADQVLCFVREGASYEEFLVPFTGRFKGRTYLRQPRPPPRVFANHPAVYSPEFSDFVRQEIAKGLRNGGMRCLGPSVGPAAVAPPTVVCPLGIEPNKPRLICDARYPNLWQQPPKFVMDRLVDLARVAQPGDLLTVWDHKSGYFHVPLRPDAQQYFGFEYEGSYYVYTVLPFGWNVSPFVYQLLSAHATAYLRGLGIVDFAYLDDSATPSPKAVALHHSYVKATVLTGLGYYVEVSKSRILPAPLQRWLGLIVDLEHRVFRVPEDKMEKFLSICAGLRAQAGVGARRLDVAALEAFAGKCVSLAPAVPGALLFTRAMYDGLAAAARAGTRSVPVTAQLARELDVWAGLRSWEGTRRWRGESHVHVLMGTDASLVAWGGWYRLRDEPGGSWLPAVICGDLWLECEVLYDITTLEMLAAVRLLDCLPDVVRDCVVVAEGDNQAMIALANSGRAPRGADLLLASRALFAVLLRRGLHLDATWISSVTNQLPDWVSRPETLAHEVRLAPAVFAQMARRWGPFTLDAMASEANAQLPRFISRWRTSRAVAADVFAYPLGQERAVYIFPPSPLIGSVVAYFLASAARGVLVLPDRRRASWWPLTSRLRLLERLGRVGDTGVTLSVHPAWRVGRLSEDLLLFGCGL